MKKIFINNFDNKKSVLLLIIIYNTKEVFNKFYFNLLKKIDITKYNVVMVNNNFPLNLDNHDKYYSDLAIVNKHSYINTNKNIGFLNTFSFIEKLFKLHSLNKHMYLYNCECDSFLNTNIDEIKLQKILLKLEEKDVGYVFFNNEYWKTITNKTDGFSKMLDFEKDKNLTHVQCFFHNPYKTKFLDKAMRYNIVKKTISDMIKQNNNIYIAKELNLNFYIFNEVFENLNVLKKRISFEYFIYKRMQYYYFNDKKYCYNNNITFEQFLQLKKTYNIKKLTKKFITDCISDKKNIYFTDKSILFYLLKILIKRYNIPKILLKNFYFSVIKNKNYNIFSIIKQMNKTSKTKFYNKIFKSY